jgi:hypothetical protein
VLAAMQTVSGVGEYRMGDYETKQEAVRLATEAAKRDVLEQVATYVDSMTVAKGLAIVKDEIRSYTAGVITVIEKQVSMRFDGGSLVIHVELTGRVDPEEVMQAVMAERQKQKIRPIPLGSRLSNEFPSSPLYDKVKQFTNQVFTPKEIEEAALHHRGEKQWFGVTQEDIDDINRLNELERRFAFDPESFFNSSACAKSLLNETCIEELQDAGLPHSEILRQNRLRADARRAAWEQQMKVNEMNAAKAKKAKETAEAAVEAKRNEEHQAQQKAESKAYEAWKLALFRMTEFNDFMAAPMDWATADKNCDTRVVSEACIALLFRAGFDREEVVRWATEPAALNRQAVIDRRNEILACCSAQATKTKETKAMNPMTRDQVLKQLHKMVVRLQGDFDAMTDGMKPRPDFKTAAKNCRPNTISADCALLLLDGGFSSEEVSRYFIQMGLLLIDEAK